jgi:hypothetical protein
VTFLPRLIILATLALAGCAEVTVVHDPIDGSILGKCYAGVFGGFCQVASPPNTTVVPQGSVISTLDSGIGVVTEGAAVGALLTK